MDAGLHRLHNDGPGQNHIAVPEGTVSEDASDTAARTSFDLMIRQYKALKTRLLAPVSKLVSELLNGP